MKFRTSIWYSKISTNSYNMCIYVYHDKRLRLPRHIAHYDKPINNMYWHANVDGWDKIFARTFIGKTYAI